MAKSKLKGGKKVNDAIKKLKKIAKEPSKIKVGLPKDASPYPDGTSVILVGLVNEFGSSDGRVPERSFLRSGVNKNKQDFINFWRKKFAKAILKGEMKPEVALKLLGELVQTKIQQEIVELKSPINAAITIALKGSSNPLIDTGHMRQSIRWELG